MKEIESLGGPLICLHRTDVERWGGVESLSFFPASNAYHNDYDHLCFETIEEGCLVVAKAVGPWGEILMINYPIPTVMISNVCDSIYLAQIDGSEPGWSTNELHDIDFERSVPWQYSFDIQLRGGEFVFFDAAYAELDFNDGALNAEIETGHYQCDWSRYTWAGKADINLIRIRKIR